MFKHILAIIFFLHFIGSNAQPGNAYSDEYLDSIVGKIGPCKKKILQEIAFLLKTKEPDELLQYSIISKWVVNNFYYLKSASGKPLKSAMQNRTIVCMHYAMIVDSLSKYCGLETEYISGYVKSETGLDAMGRHAWNSVKINGKIYLSDITWSDFEVGKRNKEKDAMSRLYFLMEPENSSSLIIRQINCKNTRTINGERLRKRLFTSAGYIGFTSFAYIRKTISRSIKGTKGWKSFSPRIRCTKSFGSPESALK